MSASQEILPFRLSSSVSACRDWSSSSKLRSLADIACDSGVSRGNKGFDSGRVGELLRHHQSPISPSSLSLSLSFFAQSELSVIWLWAGLIGQSE